MLSLVAYGDSSGEDSDCDDQVHQARAIVPSKQLDTIKNGHISDDDDELFVRTPTATHNVEGDHEDILPPKPVSSLTLSLPKPKNATHVKNEIADELSAIVIPAFSKLPVPKGTVNVQATIEEADDEFLHKKKEEALEKPKPPPPTRGRVRITIPSLKDFKDVDDELKDKEKQRSAPKTKSGLLNLLPVAKSEQNFAKVPTKTELRTSGESERNALPAPKIAPTFIPDSVKSRRPAHNTEGVDGIHSRTKKSQNPKKTSTSSKNLTQADCVSDNESSDDEGSTEGDFFSLNAEDNLPQISTNEIQAMVAKRAAKMAQASVKYLNSMEVAKETQISDTTENEESEETQKRLHDEQLDVDAMNALLGSTNKRRRKQEEDIQVMELSSDQVLPNREEWMRTALSSSTAYQPTGVLVDEEPAAGTRRKHQITYLAHKAKANEAELQAMWATNRQTRRANQSKYGF